MSDANRPGGAPPPIDHEKIHSEDFQFVLKALLDAYRPVLEEELKRAKNPDDLKKEAEGHLPNCEDEIALAQRIFSAFFTEEVARRTVPPQQRQQLDAAGQWRLCLPYVICCFIFGWLVCRRPRTFRALVYYVYRYWLCVRESVGTPVSNPPTLEERQDFQILVTALASAYKPYLTDQLATVEFPTGIPEEVLSGKIDCFEGAGSTTQFIEHFLASDIAPALFGKRALESRVRQPYWWICRCWCDCAVQFGCCLARAQSLIDALICLLQFFVCIEECFQPLRCELTNPTGCAEEQPNLPGLTPPAVGLEIDGTAAGFGFDHYTLEWRQATAPPQACDDNTGFSSIGIAYPGGGATGTVPVVGGTLGFLDTTFLPTANYEIRVCVYSASNTRTCCCHPFVLFKKLVFISQVADNPAGAFVATPPGPFDSNADIVNSNPAPPGVVVPVGGPVSVFGAAFVGDCQNRRIKCIDLRAAIGFQVGPFDFGFAATLPLYTIPMLLAPVCYDDVPPADEIKKRLWRLDSGFNELTVFWKHLTTLPGQPWVLKPNPFQSASSLPVGVNDGSGCPDPLHRCRSGQYTLLLDVTDTTGVHFYDTQHVWFDNKPITVVFHGLQGVPSCQDLHLNPQQGFIPLGAPCNKAWNVDLLGIAYDELIVETDNTYPSANFDFYSLTITKQTGEVVQVPITVAPNDGAYLGFKPRGQPGFRCEPLPAGGGACPPAQIVHGQAFDVLTALDMRIFDAFCAPCVPAPYVIPPTFPLARGGACCGYTFQLYAQDKTWSDGYAGGFHHAYSLPWAICICNDLPQATGSPVCT